MNDNKVALITGGSRGIGEKIAERFAQAGYNLIINYVSNIENVEELETKIKGNANIEILFIQSDVTSFESCENMVNEAIKKFGHIDVLVNNAGITKDTLLMRMKEEDFDKVINVNLKGTYNVTKNVIPYMMKQKYGKIINISSVVGVSGNAGQANYAASKAGIIGLQSLLQKNLQVEIF